MKLNPKYGGTGHGARHLVRANTPLYRLAEFFEEKDTELLLGK
jgi:hypothetical protein